MPWAKNGMVEADPPGDSRWVRTKPPNPDFAVKSAKISEKRDGRPGEKVSIGTT
jgi:hypothetical protein